MVNGVSGGVEKHRRSTEAQDRRGKQKSRSVAHIVDLHINRAIVAAAAAEPVADGREEGLREVDDTAAGAHVGCNFSIALLLHIELLSKLEVKVGAQLLELLELGVAVGLPS